jgi:hypothetical protein
MARDHARVRLDIWSDDEFRDLTSGAQWLYLHLLSSPALTFVGVTDWKPGRIAGHTAELSAFDVNVYGTELVAGQFLIVDPDTEEVLIRSFVKHDGLMKSPNMAKALVKAHALIGSANLRAVIVHELKRLKRAQPDLRGWDHVAGLLKKRSMSPTEAIADLSWNPSGNPSEKGSENPSDQGSGHPSATPILPNSLPPISSSSSSPSVTREAANG